MPLTREEVLQVAALCRIGLSEEDLETIARQLSEILELFRTLGELDTEGVPPTGHAASLETVLREDEPGPSLSNADALSNAPARVGDRFRVQVVLEE
ncbi:MAG: Asp-tRNA(Asn)/Glu-tRNA(Gln) amidotransferase subunit GatC [Dehalococcoidia bacterium]|nr:Asp-tRNA(Asn)/Glu-tRNA(Gln) amidotransferase subunit GatC [Dehalococcoidia bacterium]